MSVSLTPPEAESLLSPYCVGPPRELFRSGNGDQPSRTTTKKLLPGARLHNQPLKHTTWSHRYAAHPRPSSDNETMTMNPTPETTSPDVDIAETIEQGCSENGGWNKPQLALIGIAWPPYQGWRLFLEKSGLRVRAEAHEQFIALRGQTAR